MLSICIKYGYFVMSCYTSVRPVLTNLNRDGAASSRAYPALAQRQRPEQKRGTRRLVGERGEGGGSRTPATGCSVRTPGRREKQGERLLGFWSGLRLVRENTKSPSRATPVVPRPRRGC